MTVVMSDTLHPAPLAPDIAYLARILDFLNAAASLEEGLPVVLNSILATADADVALVCLGEQEDSPLFHVARSGYPEARTRHAIDRSRSLQSALTDPFVVTVEPAFEWEWKREIKIGDHYHGLIYLASDGSRSVSSSLELLVSLMMQFVLRFHTKDGPRPGSSKATAKMAAIGALTRKVGTQIRLEEDFGRVSELLRKLTGSDQMILITRRKGSSSLPQVHSYPALSQAAVKSLVHSGLMAAHVLGGGDPIYGAIPNSPDEEMIHKMGWRSAAAFPIREGAAIVGGLLVFGFGESMFSERTGVSIDPILLQLSSVLAHSELSNELRHTQRQWEVTFDSMTDIVIVTDFSGRILRANRALASRLKLPIEGLIGRPVNALLEADVAYPLESHSRQSEMDVPKLGGRFNLNVSAVLDSPTSPEAYIVVARDVTRERKQEARLHTLAHAMEVLSEGVGISTADGDLVYANPALKKLLAIPVDESQVPTNDGGLFRALSRKPNWEGETEATNRGGETIPVYVKISQLRDPQGGAGALVGIVRDLRQEKQVRETLIQTEKMRTLGQMLAGIAHELNNPLSSILGFAELMKGSVAPEFVEDLNVITQSANRCTAVVKSLLAFCHQHKPEVTVFDLNDQFREILSIMKVEFRKQNVELKTELLSAPLRMEGDPYQIQQVIVNLLTNAMQAMEGRSPARITVRTMLRDGWVTAEVQDTGCGMTPDVQRRIFEPFFTTKPAGQGTGLGLTLSFGIVKDHRGNIRVESEPGRGTIFVLEFPRPKSGSRSAQATEEAVPILHGRILVVEDEDAILDMIRRSLVSAGATVLTARNGVEAKPLVEQHHPDLVITDLQMPEISGYTLCGWMKNAGRWPVHGVILETGDVTTSQPVDFARAIGAVLLTKPFTVKELLRAVELCLGATH